MPGSEVSRLAQEIRTSLAGLRRTSPSAGGIAAGFWQAWLDRERAAIDGNDGPSPPLPSTPYPPAGFSLADLLESILPVAPTPRWVEAIGRLRALGDRQAAPGLGARLGPGPPASPQPASPSQAGRDPKARATTGLVPNQFDQTLTPQEARAACGPAAAVAFARASGRDLSLRQAVELAKTVGWTPTGGMNGVANQKRLLDAIGVPARLDTSGDWDSIVRAASSGIPVTISTPGHYFVADGYDPRSGRFHVGSSGTAYRNGKEWMTREEIERIAGPLNGALVMETRRTWMA